MEELLNKLDEIARAIERLINDAYGKGFDDGYEKGLEDGMESRKPPVGY